MGFKTYILLIITLFNYNSLLGQQAYSDTVYYNSNDEMTYDISNASNYEIRTFKNGNPILVKRFNHDGTLIAIKERRSNFFRNQFYKIAYHNNGQIKQKGRTRKDRNVGEWRVFNYAGELFIVEHYNFFGKPTMQYYMTESGKKVYTFADRLATFGESKSEVKSAQALGKYINDNLVTPPVPEDMAEAVVGVSFLINPKGELEEITLNKSLTPAIDTAVLLFFEKMENWRPAKHNGKNVYSEYSVAVNL